MAVAFFSSRFQFSEIRLSDVIDYLGVRTEMFRRKFEEKKQERFISVSTSLVIALGESTKWK